MITKDGFDSLREGVGSILDARGQGWSVLEINYNSPASNIPGSVKMTIQNQSSGTVRVIGWRSELAPFGICDEDGVLDIFQGSEARIEMP